MSLVEVEETDNLEEKRRDHDENYYYVYDLVKKKVINDCILDPANTFKTTTEWIWAKNNKHGFAYKPDDAIDYKFFGKWMLFISRDQINETWYKIKQAITEDKLWISKVSTIDSSKPDNTTHAVMIYTKDYRDIPDVIRVLDFLESSGLKPDNTVIKYKTNNQSRAGIYTNHNWIRPWVYSSDTIRKLSYCTPDEHIDEQKFIFKFDIWERKIINDSTINPTDINIMTKDWLRAENNKYGRTLEDEIDWDRVGKWLVYWDPKKVDEIWNKIRLAIIEGDLWRAEVSTKIPLNPKSTHAILIYTKNFKDIPDIVETLDYLERHELIPPQSIIKYVSNDSSHHGYKCGARNRWMYTSNSIRKFLPNQEYSFNFDISKNKIIKDCTTNPTDIDRTTTKWLEATNNKYDQSGKGAIAWDKGGKWVIYVHSTEVNEVWNKIKKSIMEGSLWRGKVSTNDLLNPNNSHVIMIYTKDFQDIADVVKTLDYLESIELKPLNTTIKYDANNSSYANMEKKSMYSSHTIRNVLKKNTTTCTRMPPYRSSRSDNSNWRLP